MQWTLCKLEGQKRIPIAGIGIYLTPSLEKSPKVGKEFAHEGTIWRVLDWEAVAGSDAAPGILTVEPAD